MHCIYQCSILFQTIPRTFCNMKQRYRPQNTCRLSPAAAPRSGVEYSDSDETRSRLVSATAGLGPASAVRCSYRQQYSGAPLHSYSLTFLPPVLGCSAAWPLLSHFYSEVSDTTECSAGYRGLESLSLDGEILRCLDIKSTEADIVLVTITELAVKTHTQTDIGVRGAEV